MNWMAPWPVDESERRVLVDRLAGLRGQRIHAVRYLIPSSSDDFSVGIRGDSHEISMGIELETRESIVSSFVWKMEGVCEGLAVGISSAAGVDRGALVRAFDVTLLDPWQLRSGSAIVEVGAAWHVPAEGCRTTLWSVRLTFESGAGVTICLGEQRAGVGLCYMPDSIVAIFDESVARSFRIPASDTTAWGVPLGTDPRVINSPGQ